ncbi:MAG TPA: enoyl-CoA hydratase/isomerase family protein [Allosphingosinicella sp.]|jgi:enoyl-CoA hydratase/carnithine racemase
MFDLALDGPVATLTLNRPEARNAVPAGAWRGLGEAAARAAASGARALVVRGAGSAFCAGADVADFAAMAGDEAACAAFRLGMREGMEALAALPIPVIAAIHGPCFGAGVALALACDVRLASPAASFAITPAKFGISYPQEDVHRLTALVGPGQASRLLLSALPVGAAEALRIGLVEAVAEDPEAALAVLTAAVAAGSADSHATLKRAIRLAAAGVASDAGQDRAFDALIASPALGARLRALRDKG